MENFNLRKFLYNNTLLTENQEVEEVSSKIKKSELKEKIRAEIMSTLSEEDTMDEAAKPCDDKNKASEAGDIADDLELTGDAKEKFKAELLSATKDCKDWKQFYATADKIGSKLTEDKVEEGFGKTLKYAAAGALGALGIKKYGQQLLGHLFNALPEEMAQELNDIIQYAVDNGVMDTLSTLFEEEGEDDLDAALDAAEDEVGDEAPVGDAPAEEPAGPELSDEAGLSDEETDIQSNLKKAYDNAVSIGDEKLANQIANTITFFTRAHVVPRKD